MKIIITENQYDRIFLSDVLNIGDVLINEENKKETIILPEPNACQIQEFLVKKGFLKKGDYTYCEFGDTTAEAFAKYYFKFGGGMKTLSVLYDELKIMGYPVGEKTGKIFGPKMAKVLSDLIKKKEGEGKKVLQTSEKCTRSCKKITDEEYEEIERWSFSDEGQKALFGKVSTKSDNKNIQYTQGELNALEVMNSMAQAVENYNLGGHKCMACHVVHGAGGFEDQIRSEDGRFSHLSSYIPTFGEILQNPELSEKYPEWSKMYSTTNMLGAKNHLDDWLYEYRHEIIDVISIAALFIPYAGPYLSGAIDLAHAGLYYKEGETTMAAIMTAVAFIPGGAQAVKALKGAGVIKGVNKVMQEVVESGGKVTGEALEQKLKKELGEKTFERSKNVINDYFAVINKSTTNTAYQQSVKEMTDLMAKTPALYKEFLSSGKLVQKLLTKNGGNAYKAYIAFLRRAATKEGLMNAGIYLLVTQTPVIEIAASEYRQYKLKADAEKGNISSIVRLAGYDWRTTRKIFGVTPYEENPQQNYDDNILLKKAWKSGWRPYDKNDPENFNFPPEEFWTPKLKEDMGKMDVGSEVQDAIDIVKDDNLSDDQKKEKLENIKVLDDFGKNKKGETTLSLDIDGVKTSVNTDSLNNVINIGNFDKIEDYQKEWESLLNKKEDGK